MDFIKNAFRFVAEYFIFFVGYLFIFVIGLVYALIRPEGLLFNLVFLVVGLGWTAFIIKNFWDVLDKKRRDGSDSSDDANNKPPEGSSDSSNV